MGLFGGRDKSDDDDDDKDEKEDRRGYDSIGDMFDGGGPGRSGNDFEGGGALSRAANALGFEPRGSDGSDNWRKSDGSFSSRHPNSTISEGQYNTARTIGRTLGIIGGLTNPAVALGGAAIRGITALQAGGHIGPSQHPSAAEVLQGRGEFADNDTDRKINAILGNPSLSREQKLAQIDNELQNAARVQNSMSAAETGVSTVNRLAENAYDGSPQNPETVISNPQSLLKGMQASDRVPNLNPNAPGTTLDPNDPAYQMDAGALGYDAAQANPAAPVNMPEQQDAATYDPALVSDQIAEQGQATAAQGEVSQDAQVTAEQIDTEAVGEGEGALGQALNDAATLDISHVIDTSTLSGRLLADELGEGNYVDSKATMQGQLEILQKQFVDPNTGEPKIPSWAAGAAREVSKIAAFTGLTGSAATAALATAIMEASLPIAQQDAAFFQSVEMANLDNRQQMAVTKAQVLANLELANLDARTEAAVVNAQAFLAMDLANLDNEQQAEIVNTQARIQGLLEDSKQQNAARMFAAENQNDFTKFYAQLSSTLEMFQAEQVNAMERFNAGEVNDAAQFNAQLEDSRQKFYAEMQFNVDMANARWRQTVQLADFEAQWEAAKIDVENLVDLSSDALNRLWDREDSILDYSWRTSEGEAGRAVDIYSLDQQSAQAAQRNYLTAQGMQDDRNFATGQGWFNAIKLGADIFGGGTFGGIVDTVTDIFSW